MGDATAPLQNMPHGVMCGETMQAIEQTRLSVSSQLDPERKARLGQFMTPSGVADFMVSLFTEITGPARLLDAGAGIGALTTAFLKRWTTQEVIATVFEIEPTLLPYLKESLAPFDVEVIGKDFIRESVFRLKMGKSIAFTHAILNPPYKKINSDSEHRALLRAVGLETVNLYTAFVGLTLELMANGGEVVAIIPRSFCNGPYYKPFREWVMRRASIDHIHLFHSRTSAFSDDEVLQENVIIKLVRGKKQDSVTITTTRDTSFRDLQSHRYQFHEIVYAGDEQKFIHIPTDPKHIDVTGVPLARCSLVQLGLKVSTGPVVDFRLKAFLRKIPERGTVPLIYPTHFAGGTLKWPRDSKKPNALIDAPETRKWLYPNGFYTIVRRLSSKEERRRIVAYVHDPSALDSPRIGFENHLNVFHCGRKGIPSAIAHGLAVFLNSTPVDDYFRRFSGHTQVNATDLRLLQYPEYDTLERLGHWAMAHPCPPQALIDEQITALDAETRSNR